MKVPLKDARYGDVILFHPTSFFGWLIAAIDGGDYSHAAIYFDKRHGRHHFVESLTDGGVTYSILDENAGNFDVFRPNSTPLVGKAELISLVGRRKYDFLKIARILSYHLFGRPVPRDGEQKLICTELVNWVYGYELTDDLSTPRTIHDAVK
jgi:hypothetical protein